MSTIDHLRRRYPTRGSASDPATWRPVVPAVRVPKNGVEVATHGAFNRAMAFNVRYLLESFDIDHMLYPFRFRAGQMDPPAGSRGGQVRFWDTDLPGSNAGRFLMGAANTLRWGEHAELRRCLDSVVDGIEACSRTDGYFYPWDPDKMLFGNPGTNWACAQQSNYCRPWLSHGLIDAHQAGNPRALPLLRRGHDWFNACPQLPDISQVILWAQGHVASTRLYLSAAGRTEDLQIAERYYVSDQWLAKVRAGDLSAIWVDGHGYPHCYLITVCEAYLDHYYATGRREYLEAMLEVWRMIRTHWQHIGGSLAINEGESYPPDSRYAHPRMRTGEHCGSVFWSLFNQRLHRLFPDDERYVAEIEKSIWNVTLASMDARTGGIRYSTIIDGRKHDGCIDNTCCEGQGTRMLGMLPEFIWSLASDGVYLNLFEPSTLNAEIDGIPVRLQMETRFPHNGAVSVRVHVPHPMTMRVRVRVPGWAMAEMPIRLGDREVACGVPGSFVVIERTWHDGDTLTFIVPIGFRCTAHQGMDHHLFTSLIGLPRYGIEYGPLLYAVAYPAPAQLGSEAAGPANGFTCHLQISDYAVIRQDPAAPATWLKPADDAPLEFTVDGHPAYRLKPYFAIDHRDFFTCLPVVAD